METVHILKITYNESSPLEFVSVHVTHEGAYAKAQALMAKHPKSWTSITTVDVEE